MHLEAKFFLQVIVWSCWLSSYGVMESMAHMKSIASSSKEPNYSNEPVNSKEEAFQIDLGGEKRQAAEEAKSALMTRDLVRRVSRENQAKQEKLQASSNATAAAIVEGSTNKRRLKRRRLRIRVTAIHVDKGEFPLSRLLFGHTLELALREANKYLANERQKKQKQQQLLVQLQQKRIGYNNNSSNNSNSSNNNNFDQVELALSLRSANTCSRQFAGAIAAEEYYIRRARLLIVSGCDDAIRGVSRLASQWRVPIMTAAGFGADLSDKRTHRTLIRVAFSLQAAVEFLFKIMKMFQWRHVNLVVDESDANSLALRHSVEKHLASYRLLAPAVNFSVALNTIALDLESLLTFKAANLTIPSQKRQHSINNNPPGYYQHNSNNNHDSRFNQQQQQYQSPNDDKWPNEITEQAIGDTLWRCSRYSRVTIVLMGQRYLRKFMLSAYDRNMANGQYAFINMPLLPMEDRPEEEAPTTTKSTVSTADTMSSRHQAQNTSSKLAANDNGSVSVDSAAAAGGGGSRAASGDQQHRPASMSHGGGGIPAGQSTAATGENEFVWRSSQPRARNAHAKQAFESLMSIYLRTPTSKAYVYLANNLNNLANENHPSTVAPPNGAGHSSSMVSGVGSASAASDQATPRRIKLNTTPYSASFYDSLLIYARALQESLELTAGNNSSMLLPGGSGNLTSSPVDRPQLRRQQQQQSLKDVHARIGDIIRNRRFDNMVTGSVLINNNGDRETDFTLDDMNPMTGKFAPVILYRGDTRETQRLGRIHWSSIDGSGVRPTGNSADCNLLGDCSSTRLVVAKILLWLALLTGPVAILLGLLYFVHSRLRLESQLIDQWWRIRLSEIEIITTCRRRAIDGSLVMGGSGGAGSMASSARSHSFKARSIVQTNSISAVKLAGANKTDVTRTTDASGAWASAADVCYGNIALGIFRLSKVALKPISKFHQSRKLMIELRNLKELNHTNLCRFVGIVMDDGNLAIVSEFCPKGSLREFFQNESMVIDWTFKYSIINDIIAGLRFLHSSALGFHGRLKSSNCLVSARFVIKLSDYGPHTLLDQQEPHTVDGTTEAAIEWYRKQILLAPEHMGGGGGSSRRGTSGSQMGDVYSFGLLLYEIITNCQPFYCFAKRDYVMPLAELYESLRAHGPNNELGPDMSQIEQAASEAARCTFQPAGQSVVGVSSGTPADSNWAGGNSGGGKLEQQQQANSGQAGVTATIGPLVDLMQACWRYEPNKRPSLMEVNSVLKKLTRGVTSGKLLENLTKRMEQYTNNLESLVEAKLATLMEEKLKTEELLYQFVPKSIASRLREGQFVEPEAFECVTVFYSDIVGFTSLSSESSPMEVVDFLSELYLCFDETLEQHDIFKVDTIGDAYIVASGLPQPNDGKHVIEIAQTALELRDRLKRFKIPHKPGRNLEMRVGIHSGPCVAGIVGGFNMPKYCVFGDTLTIGKFMESSGLPMKIHITEESRGLLMGVREFHIEPRQPRITRDGLPYQTYWLERGSAAIASSSSTGDQLQRRINE